MVSSITIYCLHTVKWLQILLSSKHDLGLNLSLLDHWWTVGRVKQPIDLVVECLPMGQKTGVPSQVESYQKLKKWFLIPPCLTLSIIRYVSRVKWSNPKKGVAPSPTPQCSSNWKGSFQVALNCRCQLYLQVWKVRNKTKKKEVNKKSRKKWRKEERKKLR